MRFKNFTALLLAAVLALSCCICAGAESAAEGELFLTVSSIDFSVVGESEDIYLGVVDRDLVTWESEDPGVVSVENGVLTAVSVGSTVIHAAYGDQEITVKAGCLAETQEDLKALPDEILSQPKRLPPEVDMEETITFYDKSLIIGDSITYFMFEHEAKSNLLGDLQFATRQGTSLNGFATNSKNLFLQGEEALLDYVVATYQREFGINRVYFLIGCIDIQVPPQLEMFFYNWDRLLARIHEKTPDVEIAIIDNIPKNNNIQYPAEFNQLVKANNVKLKEYCGSNNILFLDLYSYVQDHQDRMPAIYSADEFHLNEAGCVAWMQLLRYWAKFEQAGGSMIPA